MKILFLLLALTACKEEDWLDSDKSATMTCTKVPNDINWLIIKCDNAAVTCYHLNHGGFSCLRK